MQARSALLFCLVAIFLAPSVGARVIGTSDGYRAEVRDDFRCARTVMVRVDADDREAFVVGHPEMKKLAALVRVALGFECPYIQAFVFEEYHNGKHISTSSMWAESKWVLRQQDIRGMKRPATSAPISDDSGAPPVTELLAAYGLVEPELIDVGSNFRLYMVKVNRAGRRSYPIIAVHDVDANERAIDIAEDGSGQYHVGQRFKREIREIYSKGGVWTNGNSLSIQHFVNGYTPKLDSGDPNPLFGTRWKIDSSKDEHPLEPQLLQQPMGRPTFSVVEHCLTMALALGKSQQEFAQSCPDYIAPENVLANRGFVESKLLIETPEYSLYSARLTDSYRPVFALEHKLSQDDVITPLNAALSEDSKRRWVDEFTSLSPIQDWLAAQPEVGSFFIKLHHFLKGQHLVTRHLNNGGTEQSVGITTVTVNSHRKNIQSNLRYEPINGPVTFAEAKTTYRLFDEHYELLLEESKTRLTEEEVRQLRKKAVDRTSEKYGALVLGAEYWDTYTQDFKNDSGTNPRFVGVRTIFDGRFRGGYPLSDASLMFRFIEEISDHCSETLPENAVDKTIKTINVTTTTNGWGIEVGRNETESLKTYRVDRRLARAFDENFDRYQRYLEGFKHLPLFKIRSESYLHAESMIGASYLISKKGCSSQAVRQLMENLVRDASEQPSLQATRHTYDNSKNGVSEPADATLLYQERYEAGARYIYADAPTAWVPASPRKMVKRAANTYPAPPTRPEFRVPTTVAVEIVAAEQDSLSSMVIASFWRPRPRYRVLDEFDAVGWQNGDDGHSFGALALGTRERTRAQTSALKHARAQIVECKYRNGSMLAYWIDHATELSASEILGAAPSKDPLRAIQPAREHCPEKYTGPSSLGAYLN